MQKKTMQKDSHINLVTMSKKSFCHEIILIPDPNLWRKISNIVGAFVSSWAARVIT